MNYEILNKKSLLTTRNGEEYIDLLSTSINPNIDTTSFQYLEVTEPYTARPDLISLVLYGSDDYTDILCKFNGISNPFELNAGMVIKVPSLGYCKHIIESAVPQKSEIITTNSEIEENKSTKKLKSERRSPAEQTINDTNYYIDKSLGIIIY